MNKLELYIDTEGKKSLKRLDLFKDESIDVISSIKDSRDISKVFTDYTQNFNVPASKNNKVVFKFVEKSELVGGVSIGKKFKAEIRLNGVVFKKGYMTFLDVVFKNGLAHSYKLYFIGGLGRLKSALGETKISELDYSSLGVELTQDINTIQQSLARNANSLKPSETVTTNPDNYHSTLHSLIMTEGGHYYSEDYDNPLITDNTKNLSYVKGSGTATAPTLYGVSMLDLKPSVRLNTIIRAIEENSLYFSDNNDISFSSDFFNNPSNKEWFNLFMLMHKKEGSLRSTESSSKTSINTISQEVVNSAADTDGINVLIANSFNGTASLSNGIELTDGSGVIGFGQRVESITYTLTPSDTSAEYELFSKSPFDSSDDLITLTEGFVSDVQTITLDNPIPNIETTDGVKGHLFKFFAQADTAINLNIKISIKWNAITQVDDIFEADVIIGSEQSVDPRVIMPEMKVIDFLKGAFSMFNLIAYEDFDGTIAVDSYDNYMSTGNTVDITKYVDDSKLNMSLKMPYNNIDYAFKEQKYINYTTRSLETESKVTAESLRNKDFGTYRVQSSISSAEKSLVNKIPFEIMEYSRLKHSTDEAASSPDFDLTTQIQIGELVDIDNKAQDSKGLIYYPIQNVQSSSSDDVSGGVALHNNTNTTVEVTTFNIPSNTLCLHNTFITDSEVQGLWWFEGKSAWSGMLVKNGLYTNYHYDYVSPLFLTRNRRISVDSYLPNYLLESIGLNDTITYKNKEYKINSLKTNLQNGKSKFELFGFETDEKPVLIKPSNGASPVITILGDNPDNPDWNETYVDAGVTVTDVEDDANGYTTVVTDDSANIDTQSFAEQTVTYTATDEDGNVTVAQRTVQVVDTAIPSIDTWSRVYDYPNGEADLEFDVSSTGSPIERVEVYIQKLGFPTPTSPYRTFFVDNATFSYAPDLNTEYKAWCVAYNGSNSAQSSDLQIVILS